MSQYNSTLNITSTPTGYIMSHLGLGACQYTITPSHRILILTDLPVDCDIIIDFIYIMLGGTTSCNTPNGNALRLYRGSDNHILYENSNANGTSLPPPLIINTSSANSIRVEFVINVKIGANGFLLKHYSKNVF